MVCWHSERELVPFGPTQGEAPLLLHSLVSWVQGLRLVGKVGVVSLGDACPVAQAIMEDLGAWG